MRENNNSRFIPKKGNNYRFSPLPPLRDLHPFEAILNPWSASSGA
jgi:hypothetical protein